MLKAITILVIFSLFSVVCAQSNSLPAKVSRDGTQLPTFGNCTCDLTRDSCDLFCCCDPSCSASDIASFAGKCKEKVPSSVLPLCLSSNTFVKINANTLKDSPLCIERSNSPLLGDFHPPPPSTLSVADTSSGAPLAPPITIPNSPPPPHPSSFSFQLSPASARRSRTPFRHQASPTLTPLASFSLPPSTTTALACSSAIPSVASLPSFSLRLMGRVPPAPLLSSPTSPPPPATSPSLLAPSAAMRQLSAQSSAPPLPSSSHPNTTRPPPNPRSSGPSLLPHFKTENLCRSHPKPHSLGPLLVAFRATSPTPTAPSPSVSRCAFSMMVPALSSPR
jgi:hypothetical protein